MSRRMLTSLMVDTGALVTSFLADSDQTQNVVKTLGGSYFIQTIGDATDIGTVSLVATLDQRDEIIDIVNAGNDFYIEMNGYTYNCVCIDVPLRWTMIARGPSATRKYNTEFKVSVLGVT